MPSNLGTPFGQTTGAFQELPKSTGTAFGQAGGNVGPIASTPVTAESQLASEVSTQRQQLESLLAAAKKTGNKKGIAEAQAALNDAKELERLLKSFTTSDGTSGGTGAFAGNRSDASYVAVGRSGTSNTGKKYINGKLVSESEFNTYLYGDQKGGGAGAGTSAAASTKRCAAAKQDGKSFNSNGTCKTKLLLSLTCSSVASSFALPTCPRDA